VWVERDIDVMNALMALAMATMLAGRLNPVLDGIWLLNFVAAAAWFAGHAISDWPSRTARGQPVTHMLSCGGMLVMLAGHQARGGAMGAVGATAGLAAIWRLRSLRLWRLRRRDHGPSDWTRPARPRAFFDDRTLVHPCPSLSVVLDRMVEDLEVRLTGGKEGAYGDYRGRPAAGGSRGAVGRRR
jgi:hypothetical protein